MVFITTLIARGHVIRNTRSRGIPIVEMLKREMNEEAVRRMASLQRILSATSTRSVVKGNKLRHDAALCGCICGTYCVVFCSRSSHSLNFALAGVISGGQYIPVEQNETHSKVQCKLCPISISVYGSVSFFFPFFADRCTFAQVKGEKAVISSHKQEGVSSMFGGGFHHSVNNCWSLVVATMTCLQCIWCCAGISFFP